MVIQYFGGIVEPDHDKDAIEKQQEWQRHQYNPGHFTGGNVPYWMTHPTNRRKFAAVFLFVGAFAEISVVFSFFDSPRERPDLIRLVSGVVLASLPLFAGLSLLMRRAH